MFATIPYTIHSYKVIQYLRKYGHELQYKNTAPSYGCKICGSDITLYAVNRVGRIGADGSEYRVNVDGKHFEDADFYCEKYRSLY
jgi:hypothetical protein